MSVYNRRNAAIGWVVWTVGKRVLQKKARGAVPSIDRSSKRPNRSAAVLGAVVTAVGVAALWRRRAGDDSPGEE